MNMNTWTIFKDSTTIVLALVSAIVALSVYRRNSSTRRAEFLYDLHTSFFVNETYKAVRKVLDDTSEKAASKRSSFVDDEPEQFTDFLNFFELVAYLEQRGNLSLKDVEALLGYYLNLFEKNSDIRDYIRDTKNGFEQLNGLLDKLHPRTGVAR